MECMIKNTKIFYEIYGEGIPVLMIHGWGVDHRLMKGCMEPVFRTMDRSYKRIYFDLPGMGKTKGESWIISSDQTLELIFAFIDTVIPKHNYLLAGESYGGYLARGIISKRASSVDGLLLICPSIGQDHADFQVLEEDETLLNSLSEEDRTYFKAEGINVIQNKRVWERFKKEVLPGLKIADTAFLEKYQGSLSFDVDALEKPYAKPTLMLAGRQDSIVGYRNLWSILELYPRASFVILDKAGHALQIEQDNLFSKTVKNWLDRVSSERS
jgi:pimeloyl-ACP methyl ester carboxylesterase